MGKWDDASPNGDSFQLDVHSSTRVNFERAMKIAFSGMQEATAKYYLKDDKAGLVFFKYDPEIKGAQELPNEMDANSCIDFAWQWLNSFDYQSIENYAGKKPSGDADAVLGGFRVYNETWGFVLRNHAAIVAVKPEYILHGK